jgi:hypothetical protein
VLNAAHRMSEWASLLGCIDNFGIKLNEIEKVNTVNCFLSNRNAC